MTAATLIEIEMIAELTIGDRTIAAMATIVAGQPIGATIRPAAAAKAGSAARLRDLVVVLAAAPAPAA